MPALPANGNHINILAAADARLFTAFALLNVTGYNAENGWLYSKVREAVRVRLAHRGAYWRSALGDAGLLESMQRAGGAMLMDIIPLLSPSPDFSLHVNAAEYTTRWQRESKISLAWIGQGWLRRFYEEEDIDSLWSAHFTAHAEAATLLQRLSHSLEVIAERFGEYAESDPLEIILIPNLLDVKGRGYSLSTPQRTWLFLGPVSDLSQAEELAVHEILHRWVDIAAERMDEKSSDMGPMPHARARYRIVAESYPDLAIWVSEIVVRAATAWLMSDLRNVAQKNIDELLSHYEQIGLVGIQAAYNHLHNEAERPPIDTIEEAVDLVYHRVLQIS